MSKFQPPQADKPASIGLDPVAVWRNLTEDLIFAAAFADDPRTTSITWIRELTKRGIRFNPDDEGRKCRALCEAINGEFEKLPTCIQRAHAASEHKTFRLRHADLLPRQP